MEIQKKKSLEITKRKIKSKKDNKRRKQKRLRELSALNKSVNNPK